MQITVWMNLSTDVWGSEATEEDVERGIANGEKAIREYCEQNWPGAEVWFKHRPDSDCRAPQVSNVDNDEDGYIADEIGERIDRWIEDNWGEWFEEVGGDE